MAGGQGRQSKPEYRKAETDEKLIRVQRLASAGSGWSSRWCQLAESGLETAQNVSRTGKGYPSRIGTLSKPFRAAVSVATVCKGRPTHFLMLARL